MGRILAVRFFDPEPRDDSRELLRIAESRLRVWGAWEAQGNSLRELQFKCCLRPRRPGVEIPPENPEAEHVQATLRRFMAMDAYALLVGIYVRRMTQQEAAYRAEVSRDRAKRIVQRARLVVASECL